MDPIMVSLGPLAIRWYGFFIALGVLLGTNWAVREARARGLDEDKLLDMVVYLVIGGLIGARLVYVLTSPSRFFGENGNPLAAFRVWEGGISIHGGVVGIILVTWIYAKIHHLNMWSYLDVMTPAGCLGIIGGRIGNFMNGSDTTGRLTGWPIGFTWPDPGTDTFGALGRVIFGENLWVGYPGTCSLGSEYNLFSCVAQGGEIVRGPVHLAQFYGMMVGVILTFIIWWAFRRSRVPGYVFWQFILWYSVLRSVIEEPFRDNPLYWKLYLSEGINAPGIGLLTLTQLVSIVIVAVAAYMLLIMDVDRNPDVSHSNKHRNKHGGGGPGQASKQKPVRQAVVEKNTANHAEPNHTTVNSASAKNTATKNTAAKNIAAKKAALKERAVK